MEDGGAFVAHRPTDADRRRRVAFVYGTLRTEAPLTRTGADGDVSMGPGGDWAADGGARRWRRTGPLRATRDPRPVAPRIPSPASRAPAEGERTPPAPRRLPADRRRSRPGRGRSKAAHLAARPRRVRRRRPLERGSPPTGSPPRPEVDISRVIRPRARRVERHLQLLGPCPDLELTDRPATRIVFLCFSGI